MGMYQSSDGAQATLEKDLFDLIVDSVKVFIDIVGIFIATSKPDPWKHHMTTVNTVLKLLSKNGFMVKLAKCEWVVKESEWLGHWLTPTRICPCNKKSKVLLHLRNLKHSISCTV